MITRGGHGLIHKETNIEIQLITPEFIHVDPNLIKSTIDTARIDVVDGKQVRVADPKHLIALKLGRASQKDDPKTIVKSTMDRSDIFKLLGIYGRQDLSDLPLKQTERDCYQNILKQMGMANEKE